MSNIPSLVFHLVTIPLFPFHPSLCINIGRKERGEDGQRMDLDIYKYFRYLYNTFHFYISIEHIFILTLGVRNTCILHIEFGIRIQNDLTTYHQILFHL